MNEFEQKQAAIQSANLIVAKLQQEDYESALLIAHTLISEIEDLVLDN